MATLATIRLLDDTGTPQRIEGVLVEAYNNTTALFVTSGTTGAEGEVVFDVPNATYDLYFYKQGVSILPRQPQQVVVDSALPSNLFEVSAHVRTLPETSDPLLCRVTGFVRGLGGQVSRDMELAIEARSELIVLSPNVVAPCAVQLIRPNSEGEFDFTLFRGVTYLVNIRTWHSFLGQAPIVFTVQVPDLPAAEFHSLLFPIQTGVVLSQATLDLAVDGDWDETTEVTITWNDGSTRTSVPWSSLTLSASVEDIVEMGVRGDKLAIKPIAAGSTVLTLERNLKSKVVYDPIDTFTSDSITVTVT